MLPKSVTTKTVSLASIGVLAAAGLAIGACEASSGGTPLENEGGSGATGAVGGAGAGASGPGTGTGGDFNPNPSECATHPGELLCEQGVAITCDDDGNEESTQDCGDEVCVPGIGCQLCVDGQYSCYGNDVRSCNVGPPLHWDTLATCNSAAGQRCNPMTGACEAMLPIGNGPTEPTGEYFQYGYFHVSSTAFEGGCDTDSYGNYIYVNHGNWYENGNTLDVYMVELLDSDGDGEFEPNQHPDNPDDTGPIEERVLTKVAAYSVPELGVVHHAEVYVVADRVFLLSTVESPGALFEYPFGGSAASMVISNPTPALDLAQLGYDDVSGTWYASNEWARYVYSYHQPTNAWVAEFAYPDFTGGHMDGMEVVTDPNTGTAYVYVSDMTSDFLAQYKRTRGGTWEQVNLFQYLGTGDHVEGMGFGALNHFWITSGGVTESGALYEIGGGDLQKFTEPEIPPR